MGLEIFLEMRNLSQADLFRSTGISKASISRKVSGESPITVRDLQRIYEAFSPLSEEEMRVLFRNT